MGTEQGMEKGIKRIKMMDANTYVSSILILHGARFAARASNKLTLLYTTMHFLIDLNAIIK